MVFNLPGKSSQFYGPLTVRLDSFFALTHVYASCMGTESIAVVKLKIQNFANETHETAVF